MRRVTAVVSFLALIFISCNNIEESAMDLPDVHNLTFGNIETDLPIINLELDEQEWYFMVGNPHAKIYTKALFNYINDTVVSNAPVYLRIKGHASVKYSLKSLEIIFDEELDNRRLKLFSYSEGYENENWERINNFRLRNSGQDFTKTMMKDKALTKLAEKSDLDVLMMRTGSAAQVFVNNSYYGLLNIRSESNLKSIASLENVDTSQVVVYKVDVDNGNIEHNEGDIGLTTDLESAIDRGDPIEISSLVDESSFIDYVIFQDYIGNIDWPHNNIRMYSVSGAPFRFVLYDLDHASEKTKNPLMPELEYVSHDLGKVYRAFKKVNGFEVRLKKRQEILYTYWSPTSFNSIVAEMRNEIDKAIFYQIAKHSFPTSFYKWNWETEKMLRDFERRDHFIRKKYNLK